MKKESLLKPENAVFNQTVKAGDYFLHDVKAGQKFRIVDVEGNQASDSLFYNTYNKEERYSAENTIREQMNIFLTTGTVLRTNFNKPMLKIVADNCGRHDTLGGACATESNTVRYAIEKKFMHACRDSWMLACNEKPEDGLTKRDIAHNINFFMNVPVNEDGYLTFADAKEKRTNNYGKTLPFRRICINIQIVLCVYKQPSHKFQWLKYFCYNGIHKHIKRNTDKRATDTSRSSFR